MNNCNIHTDAGWYASYMEDEQGQALVQCLQKKVKALEEHMDLLEGELDNTNISHEMRIASAEELLKNRPQVTVQIKSFKWEG